MKIMKSVLVIGAHPDDLECMAGGTVARIVIDGGDVHFITLTKGSWRAPDGKVYREYGIGITEMQNAAKILGYTFESYDYPGLDLTFKDSIVVQILKRCNEMKADTIICPWFDDLHPDHAVAAHIAQSASRKIPRVLMGQVNWYISKNYFSPNFLLI